MFQLLPFCVSSVTKSQPGAIPGAARDLVEDQAMLEEEISKRRPKSKNLKGDCNVWKWSMTLDHAPSRQVRPVIALLTYKRLQSKEHCNLLGDFG